MYESTSLTLFGWALESTEVGLSDERHRCRSDQLPAVQMLLLVSMVVVVCRKTASCHARCAASTLCALLLTILPVTEAGIILAVLCLHFWLQGPTLTPKQRSKCAYVLILQLA